MEPDRRHDQRLQLIHVQSNVVMRTSGPEATLRNPASINPRPVKRGNATEAWHDGRHHRPASINPRPVKRGNNSL